MSAPVLDPAGAGTPASPAVDGRPPAASQPGWSPGRLAYWFYAVAAAGAVIGQTWVALTHVPWPPSVPAALRVPAVLPFALCLELLAMALAAMADERMRLGERAYGFRAFSTVVATVAVGILVAGHWPHLYWSAAFGVLSSSAYLLWLLHSAARRRDALRAAHKLADTAPDYGLWRRMRHPIWTARAAELARAGRVDPDTGRWRPLGLHESLSAAQSAIRDEKRRPAIARAVEQVVRAGQRDRLMAEIAVRTLDLDRLAAELAARADYPAWAERLASAIAAPPSPTGDGHVRPADSGAPTGGAGNGGIGRGRVSRRRGRSGAERRARAAASDGTDTAELLPTARAARDNLRAQGQPVTRDSLAAQLRADGHRIRNANVTHLLDALREKHESNLKR
jgi:hypothetical protein